MLKHKDIISRKVSEYMDFQASHAPLSNAFPDGIDIKMSDKRGPLGERMMMLTFKQYFPIRESRTEISASNARGPYATKRKAGKTDEVPTYMPVITNKKYRDAMTFNCNSIAYLQMLSDASELKYKNGSSTFKGFAVTYEKLKGAFTDEGIREIHIPLLMTLYGIFLQKFLSSQEDAQRLDGEAVFYYPDFSKKIGKTHTGIKDIKAFTCAMQKLENIVGIINNGQKGSDILPVLFYEHDKNANTIHISSPYMARIIKEIHKESIKKDKKGEMVRNKSGELQTLPAYSYLIDISIEKERNKRAVEIVMIIVVLIEQAGKNIPHIRARTIIERSSLLKESMQDPSTQKKDTMLRRSFSRAWELLQSKTKLSITYKDIELPDPENPCCIPTWSTIDMVFKFPHKGKCVNP